MEEARESEIPEIEAFAAKPFQDKDAGVAATVRHRAGDDDRVLELERESAATHALFALEDFNRRYAGLRR